MKTPLGVFLFSFFFLSDGKEGPRSYEGMAGPVTGQDHCLHETTERPCQVKREKREEKPLDKGSHPAAKIWDRALKQIAIHCTEYSPYRRRGQEY